MTTTLMSYEERLSRIRTHGYWRVIIHPTVFEQQRIPALSRCWEIVATAMVNNRLSYPPIQPSERVQGNDWIQSGGEFGDSIEVWRLYQSGQFVHTFSMSEDHETASLGQTASNGSSSSSERLLNVYNTLLTLTEILFFARGLAHREVLQPAALLRVELHGVRGRRLDNPKWHRVYGPYRAMEDTIEWQRTILPQALITGASTVAVDAAIHIFERFNWVTPPREVLEERQQHVFGSRS